MSQEFEDYYKLTAILHQLSTVTEMARTMLKEIKMPLEYWVEAITTTVYNLNLSPMKALKLWTPLKALTGTRPSVEYFKVFGCLVYVFVDPQQRTKFNSKSQAGIFIGYCDCSNAYKIIDLITKRIHVCKNIQFFEVKPWDWFGVVDSDA